MPDPDQISGNSEYAASTAELLWTPAVAPTRTRSTSLPSEDELAQLAAAFTCEPTILEHVRSSSTTSHDAIARIDAEWPRRCPIPFDQGFNYLSEPWLDDPELYPEITLSVKQHLCAAIRSTESPAAAAMLVYKHWPFNDATGVALST